MDEDRIKAYKAACKSMQLVKRVFEESKEESKIEYSRDIILAKMNRIIIMLNYGKEIDFDEKYIENSKHMKDLEIVIINKELLNAIIKISNIFDCTSIDDFILSELGDLKKIFIPLYYNKRIKEKIESLSKHI